MTGSVQFVNPMRILVKPTKTNGLDQPSLIQVDKIITVDAERIRNRIGSITPTPTCDSGCRAETLTKRDARIVQAAHRYGYSQREVADFLDLHYATVSGLVNRH